MTDQSSSSGRLAIHFDLLLVILWKSFENASEKLSLHFHLIRNDAGVNEHDREGDAEG